MDRIESLDSNKTLNSAASSGYDLVVLGNDEVPRSMARPYLLSSRRLVLTRETHLLIPDWLKEDVYNV